MSKTNKHPKLRFRLNSNGMEVFNCGKWVSADKQIAANVSFEMYTTFRRPVKVRQPCHVTKQVQ